MHNIEYHEYPSNCNADGVFKELDHIANINGDGGGLYEGIKWHDRPVFDSYEDARDYIEKVDHSYANIAVQYRELESNVENALIRRLHTQIESYDKKMRDYDKKHDIRNVVAKTVACPHCGSRLNKDFLHANSCPVCHFKDMRSATVRDTLKRYEDKIKKWEADVKEETKRLIKKNTSKAKVKWLIKIEYHS